MFLFASSDTRFPRTHDLDMHSGNATESDETC